MKPSFLVKGAPGHPLHPPLTDATLGAYTVSTLFALLGALGDSEASMAKGWWLALVAALALPGPTALTGFVDWTAIRWGSEPWNTATAHMLAMMTASVFFALAALLGHAGYVAGEVTIGPLILMLVGFAVLALGGWLGGSLVFVHGIRVLAVVRERGEREAAPSEAEGARLGEGKALVGAAGEQVRHDGGGG